MNKIIGIILVLGAFSMLRATDIPVAENQITVLTVSVSSQTASAVPSATNLMKNRTVVYLQNLDATYDLYCATSAVTATTRNVFRVPKSGDIIRLDIRGFGLYCITPGDIAFSTISVIQAY